MEQHTIVRTYRIRPLLVTALISGVAVFATAIIGLGGEKFPGYPFHVVQASANSAIDDRASADIRGIWWQPN